MTMRMHGVAQTVVFATREQLPRIRAPVDRRRCSSSITRGPGCVPSLGAWPAAKYREQWPAINQSTRQRHSSKNAYDLGCDAPNPSRRKGSCWRCARTALPGHARSRRSADHDDRVLFVVGDAGLGRSRSARKSEAVTNRCRGRRSIRRGSGGYGLTNGDQAPLPRWPARRCGRCRRTPWWRAGDRAVPRRRAHPRRTRGQPLSSSATCPTSSGRSSPGKLCRPVDTAAFADLPVR
jgi:hypothetical protein